MGTKGYAWALVACVLLAACGARTGPRIPDVLTSMDVTDATDVIDATDVVATDDGFVVEGGLPPLDPTCPGTCPYAQLTPYYPPFVSLRTPTLPATCANGFELGGATGGCGRSLYSLRATRAGGANGVVLEVDFATYLAPDGVIITGIDATGHRYNLMQTCRLQTSDVAGPSDMRPTDDTIRQFRLAVRAGTRQLDFDFGAVTTPMYIRVLGLCDFAVNRFIQAAFWRAIP